MRLRCSSSLLLAAVMVSVLFGPVYTECPEVCKCSQYMHYIQCFQQGLTDIPQFDGSYRITILNLSKNNITVLRNGSFETRNITDLSQLDLTNNDIGVVEGGAFAGLGDHLLSLNLALNQHIRLPEHGFQLPALVNLVLSHCNLETISVHFFRGIPDLHYLTLAGNRLTSFDPRIIEPGIGLELESLNLMENKMAKLDIYLVLYQATGLTIHHNPFHCDCDFRLAYMRFTEGDTAEYNELVCHSPAYLKGVKGDKLLKMNLQCVDNELVAMQEEPSWWNVQQWWILLLCALAVLAIATLVHFLHKHNNVYNFIDTMMNSVKTPSLQNLNKSDDNSTE